VPAVESGTLAVLVGGSPQDLGQARPVLERLGEIHYVGGFGSAARLKLVANTMLGITSAAAAELLAAGTAAGLDREQVFWALLRFAPLLKAREAGFMRDKHEPTMFAVRDLAKDLGLALDVYDRANAAVPLTRATRELFDETASASSDLDISAIVTAYSSGNRRAHPKHENGDPARVS
jgi:3-hydroxyisobutyrate dehydrogenase-like beta-hydroxyacid dehydrogenase